MSNNNDSKLSRAGMAWMLAAAALGVFLLSFVLIAFTPLRKLIPGYPDEYSRQEAVRNAIRIDSLENEMAKWSLYTTNLRLVLSGESTVSVDSLLITSTEALGGDPEALKSQDALLRAEVAEADRFDVSGVERKLPVEGIDFFTPVKGSVVVPFEKISHPYAEISAPEGAIVMSVLDGTVIYSGFDQNEGYTVIIAHKNDLISVYRFLQSVLRNEGESVRAGTPVATVGGARPLDSTQCLGLELWYQGEPEDPAKYISF